MTESALDVLLLDPDQSQALLLAEFLMKRDCSVETTLDVAAALAGTERRRVNNRSYDLAIIAHSPPAIDGMATVAEFRRRMPMAAVVLSVPFGPDSPAVHDQARRMGCKLVLDQPIDLAQLARCVQDLKAASGANAAIETGTFFPGTGSFQQGTGRFQQGTGTFTPSGQHQIDGAGRHASRTPSAGYQRQSSTYTGGNAGTGSGAYGRTNSSTFDPTGRFDRPRATTARVRRSVSGRVDDDAQQPQPNQAPLPPGTMPLGNDDPFADDPLPPPPGTNQAIQQAGTGSGSHSTLDSASSRFRRRATGGTSSFHRKAVEPQQAPPLPAAPLAQKQVGCAHCGQAFSVAVKPASYTVVCIHCGGLNRIDP